MTTINVMIDDGFEPEIKALTGANGRSFLAIRLSDVVLIQPPGYGAACATYARALGIKLIEAAARLPLDPPLLPAARRVEAFADEFTSEKGGV